MTDLLRSVGPDKGLAAVARLLRAVQPICAVIDDYARYGGLVREPSDRILGRIAREVTIPPPPFVTWADLCEIEDAASAILAAVTPNPQVDHTDE